MPETQLLEILLHFNHSVNYLPIQKYINMLANITAAYSVVWAVHLCI